MNPIIIFSDLDGTLLDYHDYSFTAALPALQKIKTLSIPLILNSSKTRAEMIGLRTKLGINDPFVVENGAAVFIPQYYFPGFHEPLTPHILSPNRNKLLTIIKKLKREHQFPFIGFNDFSAEQISAETGLDRQQAEQAKQRLASEPIKWLGSDLQLVHLKAELKTYNLKLVKGGRFWHIMGQTDKAKAMHWLIRQFKRLSPETATVVALGDSENDKAMLEQADFAAVIRNSDNHHLQLNRQQSVIYTDQQGPAGWREALQKIFYQLQIGY